MAYIGLRKPIIAQRTGDGKYSTPFVLGKAISLNVTPNYAEGSLNADDGQAEYDKEFNYADVTLGTSTLPIEAHEKMFGHTVSTEGKEVTMNANDESSYVGTGYDLSSVHIVVITRCDIKHKQISIGGGTIQTSG